MNKNERIKLLEKVIIWLITGLEYGDKVLFYDKAKVRRYGQVVGFNLKPKDSDCPSTKPKVYIELEDLEKDSFCYIDSDNITRKLTKFDLQGVNEKKKLTTSFDEAFKIQTDVIPENDDCLLELKNNNINHPSHYTQGNIECIDYIEDKDMNYRIGNAVKYLTRYKDKGSPVEDLEKAKWYINREIEKLLKEE